MNGTNETDPMTSEPLYSIIIIATIRVVITIVSLILNFTLLFMLTKREFRNSQGAFMISLTIAEMLGVLVRGPLTLPSGIMGRWMLGDAMCDFQAFSIVQTSSITLFSLSFLSIERLISLVHPISYQKHFHAWLNFARLTVLLLWLIVSAFFGYIIFLKSGGVYTPHNDYCLPNYFKAGLQHMFVVNFSIYSGNLVCLTFTNICIVCIAVRYSKRRHTSIRDRAQVRNAVTITALALVDLLMWLPTLTVIILKYLTGTQPLHGLSMYQNLLLLSSSLWDSLIYIYRTRKMKEMLTVIVWNRLCCRPEERARSGTFSTALNQIQDKFGGSNLRITQQRPASMPPGTPSPSILKSCRPGGAPPNWKLGVPPTGGAMMRVRSVDVGDILSPDEMPTPCLTEKTDLLATPDSRPQTPIGTLDDNSKNKSHSGIGQWHL